jgi:hypothetical protein
MENVHDQIFLELEIIEKVIVAKTIALPPNP